MSLLQHLPADVRPLEPWTRELISGRSERDSASAPLRVDTRQVIARRIEDLATPGASPHGRRHRAFVAEALEERVTAFSAHVNVLESVRALAEEEVRVVLYAARPRFLFGTLGDVAAGARLVALAEALTAARGSRVVPAVWLLGGVAEREEAGARFVDHDYELCTGRAGELLGPRGSVASANSLRSTRARLRHVYGDQGRVDFALDALMPREDEDLDEATARSWMELFGSRGLVVVEDRVFEDFLARRLSEWFAGGALARLSVDPQECDATPLALRRGAEFGAARGLYRGGEGLRYADEPGSRTDEEFAALLLQDPGAFAPGPPLSALLAETLLPVAAEVGDGHALLTSARADGMRKAVGLPPPALVLRPGLTLVEREDERALERLGIELRALIARTELPEDELPGLRPEEVTADEPPAVTALREEIERTRRRQRELARELATFDPSLRPLLRRASSRSLEPLEELLRRAERADVNQRAKIERHRRRLRNALTPDGRHQEDVLGPLAALARHGRGWIDALCDEIEPMGAEHLVVRPGHAPRGGEPSE